ncbi:hypothetical protein [Poseidonocella sp. HB161398]|uniref:hypothetical protein n=1 Tax=Poseidonocella sp. HB161398 TaxID=2320855 RepID=UPI0011097F11|nr:hypothetical protein [Poseidonocella sp. HB161398]
MADVSPTLPLQDAAPELLDLEIRTLRQTAPGLLEADVSLILQGPDGLTARNLTLTVPEGGSGGMLPRLRAEAQLMLNASIRMEKFCFEAVGNSSGPDGAAAA